MSRDSIVFSSASAAKVCTPSVTLVLVCGPNVWRTIRQVKNTNGRQYTTHTTADIGMISGQYTIPMKQPKMPKRLNGHRQLEMARPSAFSIDRSFMSTKASMATCWKRVFLSWPLKYTSIRPVDRKMMYAARNIGWVGVRYCGNTH